MSKLVAKNIINCDPIFVKSKLQKMQLYMYVCVCVCVLIARLHTKLIVINPEVGEGLYIYRKAGWYIIILICMSYQFRNEYILLVN